MSFFNLKSLFFGLPFWGFGVTVPISIKPKPKFANSEICVAFLSNPAAIPIGLGKVNPNNFLFNL
jgi:hypothetical protein